MDILISSPIEMYRDIDLYANGRNLGGLVGRLSSTGKHRCSTNPRTGPRTWQDAQRTARLEPGRRQQQKVAAPAKSGFL